MTIEYDGKKWIGEFLQNRTYAEIKADGSKESRTETINRTRDMHVRKFPELVSEITDAFTYVHRGMVVPSMRSLQFGGAAIEKVNERIYNCAFANITSWDDIHDAFFLLMCGTGFGYSVKQRHVNQLPTIKKVSEHSGKLTYTIADKKEGWADSVRMLLDNPNVEFDYSLIRPKGSLISSGGTASGPDALMKTHEEIRRILIQAAGRKLTSTEVHDIMCHVADGVVVGGVRRAALICLFDADDEAMNKAKISRYRFECKDTPITDENGEPTGLVIYGCGHTEEAIEGYTPTDEQEICQSCGKVNDYSDYSWYITDPQRGRANNSAVIYRDAVNDSIFGWPQGMSQSTDNSILAVMDHMLNSGSGEPGISLSNDPDMGFNPCVTGDTPILTSEGYIPISELIDQEVSVWNGFEFSKVTPKVTGQDQKILEISFSNGRTLKCTPYHKFHLSKGYRGQQEIVEAKDLRIGEKLIKCDFPVITGGREDNYTDMYTRGFHAADGNTDGPEIRLYGDKMDILPVLNATSNGRIFQNKMQTTSFMNARAKCQLFGKDFVPFEYDLPSRLAWFAGLIDGDGCELIEGGLQLSSVDHEFLRNIQLMLQTCGVDSKVIQREKAGYRNLPDGHGGYKKYFCLEAKAICVSAYQMQRLKAAGLTTHRLKFDKNPNRDASRFVQVTGIKELEGTEEFVYCFNEPKNHTGIFNGIITGQCHEIALKDGGLCNLTEVNVSACKSVEDIHQAMRAATFIGTLQASYTDFKVLQPKWKLNADNEALLGVSLTGQADNWKMLQEALSDKSLITEGIQTHNFRVSKKIGINPAKRITTTKPSGSTSAWLGCSSGIHADHAPFYIRHIRMEKNHKIVEALQSSEYPFLEQDQMDVDKMVVGFPVKAEEGAITKSDESAIELMERAKFIYKNWILAGHREGNNTHNVSLTVEYKPDEIEAIKKWMVDNKDSYAGISFLPRNDSTYTQMPFQEITEEEYNEMVAKITKPIDYISIDWTGTIDERIGEAACAGGSCEIT